MEFEQIKKIEEKVSEFWDANKIFKKSVDREGPSFVFFEGPPTANGQPGLHHVLARSFKDIICRYKTMQGFSVLRKAGWDTHGLPVEIQVEKELGLKNKKEIEQYGIAEFNKKAKASVWKYKTEWEKMTRKMGFWIDMSNPYITYDPNYIESVWWILNQLWDKKLLYLGHKVVPFCTRCGTPLSSHEVAQGYKETKDTTAYVKFKVKAGQKIKDWPVSENTYILAWTTTPWTLPGNVALAVKKDIDYVISRNKNQENGDKYIVAKDLVSKIGDDVEIISQVSGNGLAGLEYEPLFDVPALKSKNSYKVYDADFVTTTEGTGIVHIAPMYGEDDYELGKKEGLPTYHTVNEQGKFIDSVVVLVGKFAKGNETEKLILKYLEDKGLLLKTESYTHDYPFCWRCDTPLLYYAKDSWFIAMSKLRDKLQKNNQSINWVPSHIKDGRFGEFLKEAKDWALSRERYWGTPLPIWKCVDCGEHKIIGSYEELEKLRYKKKNTYFLMRHGASEKNATDTHPEIFASFLESDNYDLTKEGVETTQKAIIDLKKKVSKIDFIFTSPFLRTKHTAEIISKEYGDEPIIERRLSEMNHGSLCEGRAVCLKPEERSTSESKHSDGESWQDVQKRTIEFFKEIESRYEGKNIVIVSHASPLWYLHGMAMASTNEKIDMSDPDSSKVIEMFPNAKIFEVSIKNLPYNDQGEVDPHRPYVDHVVIRCHKCSGKMNRIPDLIDVWFDSGSMPYAQWHYPFSPHTKTKTGIFKAIGKSLFGVGVENTGFENNFPADYITEAIDQTRGWFYTLLAISTALDRGAPYKNVICLSHLNDEKGRKMSKSKGNVISPDEAMDRVGADTVRWHFYTVSGAGEPKSFSMKDLDSKFHGFMGTLQNVVRFFELYPSPLSDASDLEIVDKLDQWIYSRMNSLTREVTKHLEEYDVTTAAREIEFFVIDDLSNWWVRRSRQRFQRPKNGIELEQASYVLKSILDSMARLLAPFMPFVAEDIYMRIHGQKGRQMSVHLDQWPKAEEKFINHDLENEMQSARQLITLGLAERKIKNLKVRQPLASLTAASNKFLKDIEELIKDELNVKAIIYDPKLGNDRIEFDENLTEALILEGYAREIQRQIQDIRKEAKYQMDQKVSGAWESDSSVIENVMRIYGSKISSDTLLSKFDRGHDTTHTYDIEKEFMLGTHKVWLGIKK